MDTAGQGRHVDHTTHHKRCTPYDPLCDQPCLSAHLIPDCSETPTYLRFMFWIAGKNMHFAHHTLIEHIRQDMPGQKLQNPTYP